LDQNLDFHVERAVVFGRAHLVPSMDLFNVTNNNTIQALQRQQNASTANNISAVVAPRVLRSGVRVSWWGRVRSSRCAVRLQFVVGSSVQGQRFTVRSDSQLPASGW